MTLSLCRLLQPRHETTLKALLSTHTERLFFNIVRRE